MNGAIVTGKGPKIVTLCGSSRFVDVMAVCAWFIERDEGAIVLGLHLLPFWYSKEPIPDHLAEHEGIADKMDKLHLRKIDISHEIFVVNYEDYIGDSTRAETEYAQKTEKKIRWYSHDPVGEKVQNLITSRFDELKEGDKNIEKDRSACPECEEPTPADAAECSACGCVWD